MEDCPSGTEDIDASKTLRRTADMTLDYDILKPIVETIRMGKTYFGKVDVDVLHDINFVVHPGEFVAIVGQSGSGKSTLLNILGCLDTATSGVLRIDGDDVSDYVDDQLARVRGDKIGFVFQYHYLIDELTCLENVLLPVIIRRGGVDAVDRARVLSLIDRVGLTEQIHQTPDTMSSGQNQRCALVRALANEPRLILADEPTGNLDSRSGQEVFNLLGQMNRETGVAVVMVTHDERLASAADRIMLIEDGHMQRIEESDMQARSTMAVRRG